MGVCSSIQPKSSSEETLSTVFLFNSMTPLQKGENKVRPNNTLYKCEKFNTLKLSQSQGKSMFKKNQRHMQIRKRLENSWAGVFYREFFTRLNEAPFGVLYADCAPRGPISQ